MGRQQNGAQAVKWYRKAADQGNSNATESFQGLLIDEDDRLSVGTLVGAILGEGYFLWHPRQQPLREYFLHRNIRNQTETYKQFRGITGP